MITKSLVLAAYTLVWAGLPALAQSPQLTFGQQQPRTGYEASMFPPATTPTGCTNQSNPDARRDCFLRLQEGGIPPYNGRVQ